MKYLSLSLILAGVTVLSLNSPGEAVNLIKNGSFEDQQNGFAPGSDYLTLNSGSTAINNWEVTGGGIDYIGTDWAASNGNYSLDLSASPGLGGIKQTFDTIIGNKYRLTFDLSRNPGVTTPPTVRTSAAGQFQDFSFFPASSITATNLQWQAQIWEFEAKDTKTTLEFFMVDTQLPDGSIISAHPYGGAALDNVSIISLSPISPTDPTPTDDPTAAADGVPEPQTVIGLLFFGMLALGSRNQTHKKD